MRHKDRLNIMAWKNLKWVCFGNTIVKTVAIPVTLIMAWILSVIVNHATSGEVRKDIFLWGEKRMLLQPHSVPCIDY